MSTAQTLLMIGFLTALFLVVLAAGLFLGIKRQGFLVPGEHIDPRAALDFDLGGSWGCSATEEDIDKVSDLPLGGVYRARMLKLACEGGPMAVVAVHWSTREPALSFWKRYKRSVKYTGVGIIAFHNSLIKPYFFAGKLGAKPGFDLSAWYDGKWFFLIAVSATIPGHHEKKLAIKSRMLSHLRAMGSSR
jgi:hypothetical protein